MGKGPIALLLCAALLLSLAGCGAARAAADTRAPVAEESAPAGE